MEEETNKYPKNGRDIEYSGGELEDDELGQKLVYFNCWNMGHIAIRCVDRAERKAFTAQMRNKSNQFSGVSWRTGVSKEERKPVEVH